MYVRCGHEKRRGGSGNSHRPGQRSETGVIDQDLKDERQNQEHPRVRVSGSVEGLLNSVEVLGRRRAVRASGFLDELEADLNDGDEGIAVLGHVALVRASWRLDHRLTR
jgi:hypothetical protein